MPRRASSLKSPINEPALIARVLRGERAAFRPLVEAHEPAVFGLCRRLLDGDEAEAEDLSQETFLRAYRRLGELNDRYRFGPWLYQIARSLCRDRVRRKLAERRALSGRRNLERWRNVTSGRRSAYQESQDDDVVSVLVGMPEDERKVLELKYFEGRSYQEIATRMSLTFSQVDHLIRQARSRLANRAEVKRRQHERSL